MAVEKYKYIGGFDAATVDIDGVPYTVERNREVEVPAGKLDNHPEFQKATKASAKGGDK
jgi:hypothetical protein